MSLKKKYVVAFDLDGTLLDSADDLIYCLNQILIEEKQHTMNKKDIFKLLGNGALAMLKEAYKINNSSSKQINWDNLKYRFLKIYDNNFNKKSKLFPYTLETLKFLKKEKFICIVVSNKPEYFVKKILKHFDIYKYFDAVSGGDTYSFRKPDPNHLYETIKKANIMKYNCLFVGDSINDALCAKRSESKLILLKHGYSNDDISKMGADLILEDLSRLNEVLSNWRNKVYNDAMY